MAKMKCCVKIDGDTHDVRIEDGVLTLVLGCIFL